MANERGKIVMGDDEVDAFLTQQRSSTVATVGLQGRMNLVAMWYDWHEGHVWIETKAKSQKVVNLRRDPRMSFLAEAGHTYDQLRGVSLEGAGVVIEDDAVVWDVCVRIFERYNAPYTEDLKPFVEVMARNRVVVRLDAERTRSWDHRKLGLPPMDLGGTTAAFLE
ncbi:pyridoxamine 5'-phosphate oxidase family protein [Nocardioides sp.]|jgi:PPOX class probable F420-dependent enzyme|uniref:pyridoxamine 5'-phosphate oxidase family protein n=1 Tax=Nocardioides sp. TaxID=35761 RepID=UPI001D50D3BE|nr:pyridoxamine 5'-phosphate oxidase family protein [Nocardioides sp.]MBU1800790.1 pyridoxamine 5'-phosphate oxidase family protein [Actinomycetota bacterium]